MPAIRVAVAGSAGKMGRETVRAVAAQQDMALVAAIDRSCVGEDAGALAGIAPLGVAVTEDLPRSLENSEARVLVDFTTPSAVMENVRTALRLRVAPVVGATGLGAEHLEEIRGLCKESGTACVIAPNFSIGAVLMMRFSREAARHFPRAEIIELHHDQKRDAPSGTALRTAELMLAEPGGVLQEVKDDQAPRGQGCGPVRIHSVRLPGLVAHQEVIFGGLGQTLTIRHDSTSRESFMPGVLLAIRKVLSLHGLIVGLENLL